MKSDGLRSLVMREDVSGDVDVNVVVKGGRLLL